MFVASRRFLRRIMTNTNNNLLLPHVTPSSDISRSSLLFLPLIIAVWYASSVVAISTSKMVLLRASIPITLTLSQFTVACIGCSLLSPWKNRQLPPQASSLLMKSAIAFTAGFLATNASFNMVNTSFAETIKAAEPVSSVLIGLFYMQQEASFRTYTTLLVICSGVALSCVGEYSFVFSGFALAALSNICFSGRAVFTKLFYSALASTGTHPMSEISFFAAITARGLIVLLPLALLLELTEILKAGDSPSTPLSELFFYMLLNGTFFTTYNLMSYIVLTSTALVTHAVLNGFRRVVIILTTALFFSVRLSRMNVIGIVLAVFGVVCYSLSKHADDLKARK